MKKFQIFTTWLLLTALLTGCAASANDLMADVPVRIVCLAEVDTESGSEAMSEFAVELLRCCADDENTLLSPLSIGYALAMTANGADGETLAQMEQVLGLPIGELNGFLYGYRDNLPQGEDYKVHLANSIWFREGGFQVKGEFLETNADFYNAAIYSTAFDDAALREINGWVKENTDGMIPKILGRIDPNAVMYLINALSFDAKWQNEYKSHQVRDNTFTRQDGTKQNAEFMYGSESKFLEDDLATGFIKYYRDHSYAFVALLPNEGVTVAEYLSSLTGENLQTMLRQPQEILVRTYMPKFKTEYTVELSEVLREMGMSDAFDGNLADFSRMGETETGALYISNVIHKTFISVTEEGTRAGAATVVAMTEGAAMPPEQWREVYLTRPFVYMIVDCENCVPLFIGTLMDVEK